MIPIAILQNSGKKIFLDTKNSKLEINDNKFLSFEDLDTDDLHRITKQPRNLKNVENRYRLIQKCNSDNEMKNRLLDHNQKNFKLEDNTDRVIIYPLDNERIFIAGKSGCGKSSLAAIYMYEYKKRFPNNLIILYTSHQDEKAYQTIDHIVSDNYTLTVEELQNCLIVFDDVDNVIDKKLQKEIQAFQNNLMANGRKYNISIVQLGHTLMNYKETRQTLIEATRVIFFPQGSAYHSQRYLKIYGGLSNDKIKKIMNLPTRWVCFSNQLPNYIITENSVNIL